MSGAERGRREILSRHQSGRRRIVAGLLGAEASRDETGAEGDKRIEAAAEAGHTATSNTVVPPTEVGPEDYHG